MDSLKEQKIEPTSAPLDEDKGVVLTQIVSPKKRMILRVSASTPVKSLAGSIYNAIIVDHKEIALTYVGHGAAGQAIKALITAQQMMSPSGKILFYRGAWEKDKANIKVGDEDLNICKLYIYTME